jgi:hypothetical protein
MKIRIAKFGHTNVYNEAPTLRLSSERQLRGHYATSRKVAGSI